MIGFFLKTATLQETQYSISSSHLKWRTRLFSAFIFAWFLLFTLYLTQQRSFPYLYNDEYGVLGAGAVFSGLEWSTPHGMPFYGFLLSIFTFPLYYLDLEPTMLYRSILAVNAILVAGSALLAMQTIRLLPETHSEISRIGAVMAGFSYPAVQFYSAMALGETALLFCFFLIAYHLSVLINSSQTRVFNAIFLGVGVGMAQYAHPRGIAFVIASIVVILYALRANSISRQQFIMTAVFALLAILLFAALKVYLLTTFYSHEHINSSVSSFVHSRLASINIDGLVKLIQVSFGQLTYLLTSTFGLLIPGVAILALTTWKNFHDCEMRLKSNSDKFIASTSGILAAFTLLSFILMFGASVLQMSNAVRADHFFYGRYNEVMLPALIIAAIIFLEGQSVKSAMRWVFAGFIIVLFAMLVVNFYPEEVFQRKMIWNSISSWLVYIHGKWSINPQDTFFGVFTAITTLAISLVLSRKLFIAVLVAFFISAVLYNFELQHKGADRVSRKFNELANKVGSSMSGMTLLVSGTEWKGKLKGNSLQFAFPKAHVSYNDNDFSHADAVLDYKGQYCNDKNTVAFLGKATFCIINENLRSKINSTSTQLLLDSGKSRPQTPAIIKVPDQTGLDGIEIGTVDRICSLLANRFYTSWFQYCLPSIDITLTQYGVPIDGNQQLGIFITDANGKWLRQWRVKYNNQQLIQDGLIKVASFIQVPPKINKGHYWLNIATIDSHGWDWRTTMKIRLTVK